MECCSRWRRCCWRCGRKIPARFYFVGDYINRGRESRSVIDLLLALQNEGSARFVRGNHDDIFDLLLNGRCYADALAEANPITAFNWFIQFGLDNTLKSYGVDREEIREVVQRPSPAKLRSVMNAVPDEHRRFIRNLEPYIEDPDLIVGHAMWGVHDRNEAPLFTDALAAQGGLRHKLLWGRYSADEVAMAKPWSRTMYFGHTPVGNYAASRFSRSVPITGPSIVLLDTAAALGPLGRLTAYCAETGRFLQADPAGRLVKSEAAVEMR